MKQNSDKGIGDFGRDLLDDRFEFRTIKAGETRQAVEIEQICFPPHEACSEKDMTERIKAASELFLVAVDKKNGKLAGFLNGIATDENKFRDEFFTDASLHNGTGENIMLLGLDVLPAYRNQGLAHGIMYRYLEREKSRGRKMVALTCLESKVEFYKKMGYSDQGISDSTWGDEEWHDMQVVLS